MKKTKTEIGAPFTVALCGNPNSGKTTLFNLLTGSNQKVGNRPGVTVELKVGFLKTQPQVKIVDTPGVYSISPYSVDEQVTFDFLKNGNPNLIVDVVDSTNLEHSLFLTAQVAELKTRLVVALNMSDEADAKGIFINTAELEREFGCGFIRISAAKNLGTDELINQILAYANMNACAYDAAQRDSTLAKSNALIIKENDYSIYNNIYKRTADKKPPTENIGNADYERRAAEACEKYERLTGIAQRAISGNRREHSATEKADRIVLDRRFAFPIFFAVIFAIFFISVEVGGIFTKPIEKVTPILQNAARNALAAAPDLLTSLVADGIIAGVMSVVSFLPQIMLLFGCIAVLESCGYMARIAFITDRLLRKIGLGGKSFVSLVLGFGCSVPSIMSTRSIGSQSEREATVTIAPFVPCSAKMAVISYFSAKFHYNPLVAASFYFVSMLAVIIGGLILKKIGKKSDDIFLMELPVYRAPSVKNTATEMWQRGKAFLTKAGTVIFCTSVLIWILRNFDWSVAPTDVENSILCRIGKAVAPIFSPLGFDDGGYGWQFSVAMLTGIAAKEAIFESLQLLLPQSAELCISSCGAYCFAVFNILTVPCVAAVAAGFAEQGIKKGLFSVGFQAGFSYAFTFALFRLLKFAETYHTATITAICVTLLIVATVRIPRYLKNRRYECNGDCPNCKAKIKN